MNESVNIILKEYQRLCSTPSDINEHLPVLKKYASKVGSVYEFGVRSALSTYAFLAGLIEGDSEIKSLKGVDIENHKNIEKISKLAKDSNVNYRFIEASDLDIEIESVDLLFIDSWHCYGQLKRELQLHSFKVKKYIILHDTTIDGEFSEIERIPSRWKNASKPHYQEIIKNSGFNDYELKTGLWPAVEDFLLKDTSWKIKERLTNNNGLTVLVRK